MQATFDNVNNAGVGGNVKWPAEGYMGYNDRG